MKVYITKEFKWDMAHMLAAHSGMCKNLHGHTYKLQVKVTRKSGNLIDNTGHSDGMVIDFKDLKEIVKEKIINPLDHAFMYWVNSSDEVEHKLADALLNSNRKVFKVNYRPTAEEMAKDFFKKLTDELDKYNVKLVSVKVWETPTSFAEVNMEGKNECI
ncbi:MAG: 6-carboxytetrahydropterin synthase [Firmicutes bacterium]|nr:6-carboxytetrahydropterin synthase [Bacillota bacterium]